MSDTFFKGFAGELVKLGRTMAPVDPYVLSGRRLNTKAPAPPPEAQLRKTVSTIKGKAPTFEQIPGMGPKTPKTTAEIKGQTYLKKMRGRLQHASAKKYMAENKAVFGPQRVSIKTREPGTSVPAAKPAKRKAVAGPSRSTKLPPAKAVPFGSLPGLPRRSSKDISDPSRLALPKTTGTKVSPGKVKTTVYEGKGLAPTKDTGRGQIASELATARTNKQLEATKKQLKGKTGKERESLRSKIESTNIKDFIAPYMKGHKAPAGKGKGKGRGPVGSWYGKPSKAERKWERETEPKSFGPRPKTEGFYEDAKGRARRATGQPDTPVKRDPRRTVETPSRAGRWWSRQQKKRDYKDQGPLKAPEPYTPPRDPRGAPAPATASIGGPAAVQKQLKQKAKEAKRREMTRHFDTGGHAPRAAPPARKPTKKIMSAAQKELAKARTARFDRGE